MKKRIFTLLLAALCVIMCISMVACGSDDENDDKKGEKGVSFEDIVENMEKVCTAEDDIEYMVGGEDDNCEDLLYECYYGIEEVFEGSINKALYCENEGEGDWWTIVVFECGSEKEAKALEELTKEYCDSDVIQVEKVVGKVLVISWSEENPDIADRMLNVALGNEAY